MISSICNHAFVVDGANSEVRLDGDRRVGVGPGKQLGEHVDLAARIERGDRDVREDRDDAAVES